MKIIIGSPDPSFNPIELEVKNEYFKAHFRREYYDINDENLPRKLYFYTNDVIGGRWSKAEQIIMKDARWAYNYAYNVIKGRWPEAEPIIMKKPKYAHYYAINIIKGKWPEAEPHIKKSQYYLNRYKEKSILFKSI